MVVKLDGLVTEVAAVKSDLFNHITWEKIGERLDPILEGHWIDATCCGSVMPEFVSGVSDEESGRLADIYERELRVGL